MRGLGLAVVILLGCSGKPAATTPTETPAPAKPSAEVETQIEVMTKYQDQMCACADKACVDKVAGEMATWSEQQAKKYAGREPVPSDEQKARMTAVSEKLGGCMNQVSASAPPAE
ncbi:MAG TPA: hypothetical protein VM513_15215 [Kofleriaceae bacterium]|nr:hypothetical protein [Kofleriaceae bacterium]